MADPAMLQGILRWSLAQSDGLGAGDAKPLSEEDRKFLEGAMSQIVDETKRIKVDIAALNMRYPPQSTANDDLLATQRRINRIMQCIKNPTKYKFDEETEESQAQTELIDEKTLQQIIYDYQIAALEEIEDRVLSIDMSIDAVTLGILPAFIDLLSNQPNNQTLEQSLNLRWRICNVLATITQNNPRSQQAANESGIIDVLLKMIQSLERFAPSSSNTVTDELQQLQSKVIVKTLYALTSMCRECPPNVHHLVHKGGVELVIMVLESIKANRELPLLPQMATKSLSLIRSLIASDTAAVEIAEKCGIWELAASFIGHDDVNLRDECMRTLAALVQSTRHSAPCSVHERIAERVKAVAASTDSDYKAICENEMDSAELALKGPLNNIDEDTPALPAPAVVDSTPIMSLATSSSS